MMSSSVRGGERGGGLGFGDDGRRASHNTPCDPSNLLALRNNNRVRNRIAGKSFAFNCGGKECDEIREDKRSLSDQDVGGKIARRGDGCVGALSCIEVCRCQLRFEYGRTWSSEWLESDGVCTGGVDGTGVVGFLLLGLRFRNRLSTGIAYDEG